MALTDTGTILELIPVSGQDTPALPPYSARGIVQTLENTTQDQNVRRTINGVLVDLTDPAFRKYKSTISGKDVNTLALNDTWVGREVDVFCVQELAYPTGGTPGRPEVSGSSREEGHFTFYRPVLRMMVKSFQMSTDEWPADRTWQLDLEEV